MVFKCSNLDQAQPISPESSFLQQASEFATEEFKMLPFEQNDCKTPMGNNGFTLANLLALNQGQLPAHSCYENQEEVHMMDDDFLDNVTESGYQSHDDNSNSLNMHLEAQAMQEVANNFQGSSDASSFSYEARFQELQMQREALIFQRFEESMRQTDRSREMLRRLLQGEQQECYEEHFLPEERQHLYNWVQEQQPQMMFSS